MVVIKVLYEYNNTQLNIMHIAVIFHYIDAMHFFDASFELLLHLFPSITQLLRLL